MVVAASVVLVVGAEAADSEAVVLAGLVVGAQGAAAREAVGSSRMPQRVKPISKQCLYRSRELLRHPKATASCTERGVEWFRKN
jgi:hypothetical protein